MIIGDVEGSRALRSRVRGGVCGRGDVPDEVDASAERVARVLLHTGVIDADLGIRDTAAVPGLGVRLVLNDAIALRGAARHDDGHLLRFTSHGAASRGRICARLRGFVFSPRGEAVGKPQSPNRAFRQSVDRSDGPVETWEECSKLHSRNRNSSVDRGLDRLIDVARTLIGHGCPRGPRRLEVLRGLSRRRPTPRPPHTSAQDSPRALRSDSSRENQLTRSSSEDLSS